MPRVDADTRAALIWEILGFVFIMGAGGLMHFVYAWSGDLFIVAPFAAVNESVWEHLKLAFWPSVAWTMFERVPLKTRVNNFWFARTLGTLLMPLAIVALFYFYTFLLGHHVLYLDMAIFVIAVAFGQYVSYRLFVGDECSSTVNLLAPALMVLMAVLFVVFTFFTPEIGLFRDGVTGTYGLGR
ncbi:MAG: hypothetical protein JXA58_06525 [Dehalococcoidia bacterium]|nr:hypothetical protein [Dehalococcoidia bacterium]